MKNVASPEKEGGSCGGQDHLCKNDGRSFLSRFTAQSHADASTRWFPRSRGIRSVAWLSFSTKISPSSDCSVKREQRREIERDPSDKKGTAKRRPRRRERDGKRDANRISATRDAL